MPNLEITRSVTHTRPHFASHTQSSLMKRRTPMKLKKKLLPSINDTNRLKRSQGNIIPRLSGIYKRQKNVTKQSRSMQMMIMILKQQQDRRATIFPDSKLIETTCQLESSFVSLQNDLIKDISRDLKRCTNSPAKLITFRNKLTKNELEKHIENSNSDAQNGTNCTGGNNSDSIRVSSEDHTIIDIACELQLCLSNEEKPVDSRCKVEDPLRRTETEENPNDVPNEDCSKIETQIHPQGVNATTTHKNLERMRTIWTSKKAEAWNKAEHIDVDCAFHTDLQNFKSTKSIDNPQDNCSMNNKPIVNVIRKKGTLKKNITCNQRAWKPPGISKTRTESTTLLQPVSQKLSQLTEKFTASSKNKYSSIEHAEAFKSESTSTAISANQSKMLKENRDPCAYDDRMTKICQHLAETKQRQRLQGRRMLPKKKLLKKTIDTKVSDKRDDLKLTKLRRCQTQLIMPKEFSNDSNVEQHHTESTYNRRSRTLEVIHTLRKIIDSVRGDENTEQNMNDDFDLKKDDSEIQTLSNRDTSSRDNELDIFTKEVNLDGADRSSRRAISTELDLLSYQKIDTEQDQDLKEILKLTQIVATHTSSGFNRSVVDIGCNTSNVVYNDVAVSCDLIDFTNLNTKVNPATIEDESILDDPIHTESSSVKHIKINAEGKDENKELLFNEYKETLKLENYDNVEIPAETINDAAKAKKIVHEKACQVSLKSFKNSDDEVNTDIDERPESTNCFNNHGASNTSVNDLFARSRLSTCEASCSFEKVTEYPENDVQSEDTVTSELEMDRVPSGVIAAFELAAKRALNLHEALFIYYENLMSKESRERNEETIEDYELSDFRDDCLGTRASCLSREDEDKIKFECEAICHFANNGEDFDGFSACSSRGSSSDRICEFGKRFPRSLKNDYFEIDREEDGILSENEQAIARSALNERSDRKNVQSLTQLLRRMQEEYALELLQSERYESDESFETEGATDKIVALPATINKTCLLSRENLFLICCVVCIVVLWFLQLSFRCNSTK